jgi:hypothetical protein
MPRSLLAHRYTLPCYNTGGGGGFGGHPTLNNGLRAVYHLEEAAAPWIDSCGGNNLANVAGSPVQATGKNGYCLSFPASTANVYGASILPGRTGDGFCAAIWVNRSAAGASLRGICGSPATSNPAWAVRISATTGRANVYVRDEGGNVVNVAAAGGPLCDGAWHLLIMNYNEAGDKKTHVYVPDASYSGVSTPTGAYPKLFDDSVWGGGGVRIGKESTYYFGEAGVTALADELMLWDRYLVAGERTDLFAGGAGLFY